MKKLCMAMVLAAMAVMTGCTVYHPQAVDLPLINHRGDLRVDGAVSMSTFVLPDALNLNATGTYGLTDHVALQAHANYGFDNAYGQAAAGLYWPLGSKFVLEGYAGLGFGGAWRDGTKNDAGAADDEATNYSTYHFGGHYALPFVQLNAGWHDLASSHVELGFGLKAGGFMPDYSYVKYDADGAELDDSRTALGGARLLLEPQLMVRFGGPKVKFSIKGGFCIMPSELEQNFVYDFVTLGAGLTFSL